MQKQSARNIRLFSLVVVAALAVAVGAFLHSTASTGASGKDTQSESMQPFKFSVIKGENVTLVTELPGRVSALTVSEVRPQVNGIITQRLFTEGSDVNAGQVLYQIDPAIYEAAYSNAQAVLAKAEANEVSARLLAERYGRIVKSNAVSRQEYDDAIAAHKQALADINSAKQAVETARINLGYTKITAPVSGRIGRSKVTPGALATQHQAEPLATIQQLDQVYVDVTQSNSEMMKLRRAMAAGKIRSGGIETVKARLKLEDGSPYVRISSSPAEDTGLDWVEGTLLFSDVTIEKSTGVVNIRALFDNPDNILLPGMYVRAVVEEGTRDDAVLLPQRTVMRDTRGRPFVYVLAKERPDTNSPGQAMADNEFYVTTRLISIDRNYGHFWLLSSGLEPGDRLLLEGFTKVRPGMAVSAVSADASAPSLQGIAQTADDRQGR